MTILIFDRKEKNGKKILKILEKLYPDSRTELFKDPYKIESYAHSHIFKLLFLVISDRAEEDLLLGKKLMGVIPEVDLIPVAEDQSFLMDAIRLHASGYILLPVTEEKVKEEFANLLYPDNTDLPVIRVEKGSETAVFIDDKPVNFRYKKTKDLFSLLLDMEGAMITTGSIKIDLWGEESPPEKTGSYLQNLRSDLIHTLESLGYKGLVCHRRGRMWIDMKRLIEDKEDIF